MREVFSNLADFDSILCIKRPKKQKKKHASSDIYGAENHGVLTCVGVITRSK